MICKTFDVAQSIHCSTFTHEPQPPRFKIKVAFTLSLIFGALLGTASVAHAQSVDVTDLVIKPRGEAGYSTSGAGFDSFVYLDSFAPFAQTPGADLWYVQSRLRLDSDADSSGSALVGYRRYNPSNDAVWGGYVGYDGRNTGANYFNQLSAGLEFLGDVEVRLNGYVPIGQTRQMAGTASTSSTATAPDSAAFSENSLLLTPSGEVTTTTSSELFEAAVGGLDLEVGTQLLSWTGGDLRGYAGVYYQDPAGSSGTIGGRGRLTAQIGESLNMGLSLSSDSLFDTQVMFNIGTSFGGTPQREETENRNIDYLGSFAQRQSNLVVDTQEVVTVSSTSLPTEAAINPTTGQPYRFVFVTGGASGNGDGTVESPFAQVTEGITDTTNNSDGVENDIVYVQAGTNPGLDGFVVPDNVQVLGSGIVQTLDTAQLGMISLPDSGSTERPLINQMPSRAVAANDSRTSMVALGNNTTLSGFEIEGSDNVGVLISDASDIKVLDNVISSTGQNANGVLVETTDVDISNIRIADGNRISTANEGSPGVTVLSRLGNISNVEILGNDIITEGTSSIGLSTEGDSELFNITVSDNSISMNANNGANGVSVLPSFDGEVSNMSISQNRISAAGENVRGVGIATSTGKINGLTIVGNNISTSGNNSEGIGVLALEEVNDLSIINNNIVTVGDAADGIRFGISDISRTEIINNTISTSGIDADGIFLDVDFDEISEAKITDNTITQAGRHSISILTGFTASCVAEFIRNTSSNPGVANGGNDLNITTTGSGALDFVGFDDIRTNNIGFDSIVGTPSNQPASCP